MKKNNHVFVSLFTLVLSGNTFAQTQVPHTFSSGQPARAAEVNENFEEVESAIDQNASEIAANASAIAELRVAINALSSGIQVLADGVPIGMWLGQGDSRPGITTFRAQSTMNYIFDVVSQVDAGSTVPQDRPTAIGDLMFKVVWFELSGCTGQAYVSNDLNPDTAAQGYVFRADDPTDPTQTYYVPTLSLVEERIVPSRRSFLEGGCVNFAMPPSNPFVPAFPNDPDITGVASGSFLPPIVLGF